MGDHTESLRVDYDPSRVSYSSLLNVFWENHDPVYPPWSRQYMSIIFYHNEEQKKHALQSKEREVKQKSREVYTEIIPAGTFFPAEDYHQKFRLRREYNILGEFRSMYPDEKKMIASTAAARVNGYLAGYGSLSSLQKELDSLGLSPRGQQKLLEIVRTYERQGWKTTCKAF